MKKEDSEETGEVISNVEIPSLNLCTTSIPPLIYSAREYAPLPPLFEQTQSKTIAPRYKARNTNNPPYSEVAPGQIPYSARPSVNYSKKINDSKLFSQLKEDQDFVSHIEEKLNLYRENHATKINQFSRDYNDHFYKPLQKRIIDRLSWKEIAERRKERESQFQLMDQHPIPIRSNRNLPPLPTIRVDISDLQDPIMRYKIHQKQENSLSQYVLEANGYTFSKVKLPQRKTINSNDLKILESVRFFHGNQPGLPHGSNVGKKYFSVNTTQSVNTKNCFDFFTPNSELPTL